ncbi:MAG: glycoside hydrolase family 3 N-terminal domain-containing protein [Desulfovibrio sp.]
MSDAVNRGKSPDISCCSASHLLGLAARKGGAALCLLALALIFCFSPLLSAGAPAAQVAPAKINAGSAAPSLDVMIGSMLMLGFRGADLPQGDAFLAQVRAGHVGHIILFDRDVTTGGERNIISPQQVRQLTSTLRAASPGPLLIAVDQEGGRVRRLKPQRGFADLPSAQSMGAASPEKTRAIARQLGVELASLGISVDLAPVADVNSNPANPAIGVEAGSAPIRPWWPRTPWPLGRGWRSVESSPAEPFPVRAARRRIRIWD